MERGSHLCRARFRATIASSPSCPTRSSRSRTHPRAPPHRQQGAHDRELFHRGRYAANAIRVYVSRLTRLLLSQCPSLSQSVHLWQLLLARSQPLPDIIVGNRAVVSTRRRVSRTHSGVESRGIAESWGGDAVRAARFSHCFHARPRPQSQIDRVHGQTEMRSRQRYRVRAAQMYIISLPGLLVHSATCTPLPLPLPCQPKCFTTSSTSREQDTV